MSLKKYFHHDKEKLSSDPFVVQTGRFKDGKSNPVHRTGWAEDAFISEQKNNQATVGQSFNTKSLPFFLGFVLFCLLIILGRAATLQIVRGDYYYSMAEGNRIRIDRIEPARGIIYDRNMKELVRNQANFMLYFVPVDLLASDNVDAVVFEIEKILGTPLPDEVKNKLKTIKKNSLIAYQPLFVEDNIDYERAMKLYLKSTQWPGVILTNKSKREYLLTSSTQSASSSLSLSHVLGYTGKINEEELEQYGDEYLPIDYIGKMGIEFFWENELKGLSGKKQIEVDALGKETKIVGQTEAVPGNNLVLSLDAQMQIKLEELLQKELNTIKAKRASAIVMDPNNGEILAMVGLPAFDNNDFASGISKDKYNALINNPDRPLFNRSVSGEFPSGSTIKPVMSAAALEEGVINENTSVLSTGGLRIGQWFFPDWKAGGHGTTNVRKAIAESVNTFFYYIGGGYQDFRGLGIDKIVYYENLFGLGAQTGIDLAGEASGFLPTTEWKEKTKGEKWYIGDTYHVSIGQGDLLVTPLQVAAYTSVFANGGKLYRPHLAKSILSNENKISNETKNDPIRENFIKPYNINIVREGMRQTITAGSARSLQSVPVPVAGKTGTAQWSTKAANHAWFTGFAPYDKSELVITILIEEGGEGSSVAVPVAREFLTWYFGSYKTANSNNQAPRNK